MALLALTALALTAGCGGGDADPKSAVVWAVGDGPDGSSDAKRVADWIVDQRPDRLFYLGDVYREPDYTDEEEEAGEDEKDGASESDNPMRDYYDPAYGALKEVTTPVAGDHEWDDDREDYLAYWREARGEQLPSWYSLDVAGWQVVALNTEDDIGAGSPQLDWLAEQMREAGTCRIVLMHRPRFTAGDDGDHDDLAPVWDAISGRAAMVLSGDDHNMQRFGPVDGVTQFVSGAGGRSNYDVDEDDPRLAFADDDSDGALRLELRPGSARHSFVERGGSTLDSGQIRCAP
jgi:hypothetical protein